MSKECNKWVWDADGNPICASNLPEGGPCVGEVVFFHSYVTGEDFGMCMSCTEMWEEEVVLWNTSTSC